MKLQFRLNQYLFAALFLLAQRSFPLRYTLSFAIFRKLCCLAEDKHWKGDEEILRDLEFEKIEQTEGHSEVRLSQLQQEYQVDHNLSLTMDIFSVIFHLSISWKSVNFVLSVIYSSVYLPTYLPISLFRRSRVIIFAYLP